MDWTKAQTKLGLVADNIAGPKTYQALFDYAVGKPTDPKLSQAAAKYFAAYSMTTPALIADFIGQTAHESANYTTFSENLNYSSASLLKTFPSHFNAALATWAHRNPERVAEVAYGVKSRTGHGRMGNNQPGDGYKYRGRGILQLTGKDNYKAYGKALGLDLVNNPDLASDPGVSLLIALEYYRTRNIPSAINKGDLLLARKLVNGGTLGYTHVNDIRNKVLSLFK